MKFFLVFEIPLSEGREIGGEDNGRRGEKRKTQGAKPYRPTATKLPFSLKPPLPQNFSLFSNTGLITLYQASAPGAYFNKGLGDFSETFSPGSSSQRLWQSFEWIFIRWSRKKNKKSLSLLQPSPAIIKTPIKYLQLN